MAVLEKFIVEKSLQKADNKELMKEVKRRGMDVAIRAEAKMEKNLERKLSKPEKMHQTVTLSLNNFETKQHLTIPLDITFSNAAERQAEIKAISGRPQIVNLLSQGYKITKQRVSWN